MTFSNQTPLVNRFSFSLRAGAGKETYRIQVIANKHSEDAFRSPGMLLSPADDAEFDVATSEPPGKSHRGRRDYAARDQHLNGGFGDAGGFDGITAEGPPNIRTLLLQRRLIPFANVFRRNGF